MHRFRRRATHWIVFLIGDFQSFHALIQMETNMALENLQALVERAQSDLQRLATKAGNDEAALEAANQQIAGFESQAVAIVQPLADAISSAAPEPEAAPQADADTSGEQPEQ